MAEKTAQEQYADARKALIDVGQHGIAWSFQKAWDALREEHRADTQAALDKQALSFAKGESAVISNGESAAVAPIEPPFVPQAGAAGEGGGASSQAGTDDKSALPGGVIA